LQEMHRNGGFWRETGEKLSNSSTICTSILL